MVSGGRVKTLFIMTELGLPWRTEKWTIDWEHHNDWECKKERVTQTLVIITVGFGFGGRGWGGFEVSISPSVCAGYWGDDAPSWSSSRTNTGTSYLLLLQMVTKAIIMDSIAETPYRHRTDAQNWLRALLSEDYPPFSDLTHKFSHIFFKKASSAKTQ